MVKGIENSQMENLIKDTAKGMFFSKGLINATTQEIANEAGINRTMIHYYFRSRDQLFNVVLQEAMLGMMDRVKEIFNSNNSLREKIKSFLDVFITETSDYPYLENFLVSEIARDPEKILKLYPPNNSCLKDNVKKQLDQEVQAGTLAPITIDHFICNLMALCKYPLIAKPIIQTVCGYDDAAYKIFLIERKKVVYFNIFNEPYPEN
ncbi:MAG: TetR/AcrR family transcriptional regulator [Bacteroidota bacterium]